MRLLICDDHAIFREEARDVRQALDGGASGFIPKSSSPAVFRSALQLVLEGSLYIPPLLVQQGAGVATAAAQLEFDQVNLGLESSVAGAGDVNGDGYSDVIVGAEWYEAGQWDEGAAFVFLGSASGIADGSPATAAAQLESDQADAWLGWSVAGAGDVNGDGFADVIVGALQYVAGQTDEGAAFVFLGNGSTGRRVLARQLRGAAPSTRVPPWSGSGDPDGFSIEMFVNHPDGTGRALIEAEACPSGVPFGDASCTSAVGPSWAVGGFAPDVLAWNAITGLDPDTLYRWRARAQHAPTTGPIPANPAHGPWRRLGAQAEEADIRTIAPCNDAIDNDGDGVIDHPDDPGCSGPNDLGERDEVSQLPAGTGTAQLGAGSSTPGGVDLSITSTAGGTFSGEAYQLDPGDPLPLSGVAQIDFLLANDPILYWQLEFDGTLSGSATLTFGYDPATLTRPENTLAIWHYVDTDDNGEGDLWVKLAGTQDLVEHTITVTVDSFSPFAIGSAAACQNGADDDADGLADFPADPGCADALDDSERSPALVCDDGLDNDADTLIDHPADPHCTSPSDPTEVAACANGTDGDNDGAVDLADPGCANAADDSEDSPSLVCDDGLDNDGDGLIDYQTSGGDPACQTTASTPENPKCDDDLDNDGDAKIDWDGGAGAGTIDPQCAGLPWKNKEAAGPCGSSAELAFMMPLVAGLARRRVPAAARS